MVRQAGITLVAVLLGAFSLASADTLQMDSAAAAMDDSRPNRGMTQQRVEAKFGSPDNKVAAVGDPPISSWEYKEFVVFFEYDRVIHAVTRR